MNKNLYYHVEIFHDTIVEIKDFLSDEFKNFPVGACGSTSVLLGTYLRECGFGSFKYVCGEKYFWNGHFNQEYSHAWLETEDSLVIDITAYQFPEIGKKIVIQKKNLWYKQWTIKETVEDINIDTYKNLIDIANYEFLLTKIKSKIKKGL